MPLRFRLECEAPLQYAESTTVTNEKCKEIYGSATVVDSTLCTVPPNSPCHVSMNIYQHELNFFMVVVPVAGRWWCRTCHIQGWYSHRCWSDRICAWFWMRRGSAHRICQSVVPQEMDQRSFWNLTIERYLYCICITLFREINWWL